MVKSSDYIGELHLLRQMAPDFGSQSASVTEGYEAEPQRPAGQSPRVAYLTSEYPSVSHTFILREVQALRDLGYHVETCSVRRTDPDVHHRGESERTAAAETFYLIQAGRNPVTLFGAVLHGLKTPERWWRAARLAVATCPPGFRMALWQFFYFLEAMILAKFMKDREIEMLHNHFAASSCTVAMLASELSGIPYSLTMHGPLVFYEAHRWRIDEKIRRASRVICISNFCRSQGMLFSELEHWDKFRIVHCGVDPTLYADEARPIPQRGAGKRVLFVGRLAAMKGVPVLLQAFAQAHARHKDARLTLIGDGPERGTLEELAARLGIADNVNFVGFKNQAEVASALSQADIFALPSFAEGLPVVLMEAMAAGLPVVTTRIAGVAELVEDGVSGRLVHASDADSFADALDALMASPAAARRMGETGRKKVHAEFNSLTEAARLGAIFTEAVREQAVTSESHLPDHETMPANALPQHLGAAMDEFRGQISAARS